MKKLILFLFLNSVYSFGQSPISFTVFLNALPTCSSCCDGGLCVTAPTGGCNGGYTAEWSTGNTGPASCSPGMYCYNTTYTICVFDLCDTTCKVFTFPPYTGIFEYTKEFSIKVFPNPVSNSLFISAEQNELRNSSVEIINTLGQTVYKTIYSKNVAVSDLQNGLYFLVIETPDKRKLKTKFIKE